MKRNLLSKKLLAFTVPLMLGSFYGQAQTYDWVGNANTAFYNSSNWTSTDGSVIFDDSSFKTVRTHQVSGNAPVLDQIVAWQPGIFDVTDGVFTVNADFNVYFNDKMNGTVTINSGATFTCRNIFRVGREGAGTVNINGGTFQCLHETNWQGIFIGALSGGNGTVNVNDGGLISGGYQVEVGTRDFYPTGVLNVNAGGTSEAYWTTVIGPNGTVNMNGGTMNCGQALIIGDLYLDNAGNIGTIGSVVGQFNLNSGTVTVNNNDLDAPYFFLHANAKLTIDNGTLIIKRTGTDFTDPVNAYVTGGQIVPAAGKQVMVSYDGVNTTVTAQTVAGVAGLSASKLSLYPNPAESVITLASTNVAALTGIASIYNLQGQKILQQNVSNNGTGFNLSVNTLAAGVYVISLSTDAGLYTSRFIKK